MTLYCPCCKDEFEEGEKFCLDCKLPLLEGTPDSKVTLCDCDELPYGEYIRNLFEMEDMDAAATVSSLTGIRDSEQLGVYIEKLLSFNGASCDQLLL